MPAVRPAIRSLENLERDRCVDFIAGSDGRWTFKEYRREPEDGRWALVADYAANSYPSEPLAIAAAEAAIVWFAERLDQPGNIAS